MAPAVPVSPDLYKFTFTLPPLSVGDESPNRAPATAAPPSQLLSKESVEVPVYVLLVPVIATEKEAKPAFATIGFLSSKLVKSKVPEYPLAPQLNDAATSAVVVYLCTS